MTNGDPNENVGKHGKAASIQNYAIGSHSINVPGVFVQLAILTKGFGWFWVYLIYLIALNQWMRMDRDAS